MIPIESVNIGILKISIKSNDWYILKLNFKTQVQWSINAQTMLYIWVDPFALKSNNKRIMDKSYIKTKSIIPKIKNHKKE
jgi:hypothetical protein